MNGDRTQSEGPPSEVVHPTSLRRMAWTFGTMLVVTFAINAAAAYALGRHPLNQAARVIRAKWMLLTDQRKPVDTLVLGDSSGNHGVIPEILAARLGGSALNLCTVGDLLAVNDAWMLERYLRDVGTPRTVVVVHTFDVWGREKNPDAMAQVPLPFGFWNEMQPPAPLSFAESVRVLLDRYAPLYSQDQTISRLLKAPRRTLSRSFDMEPSGFYRSARALPEEVLRDFKSKVAQLEEDEEGDPLSAENRRALEVLSDLAEQHDLEVYVAHAPLYEGLWAKPDFRRLHGKLDQALEGLAAPHPRLHVIPGPPQTFPADRMTNVDHLIAAGARTYTEALAEEIAARRTMDTYGTAVVSADGAPRPDSTHTRPAVPEGRTQLIRR